MVFVVTHDRSRHDCSLGGAFDRQSDDKVGHLNTILAQGGGNLNDPIFKSSNARGLPGEGGMLKFRVDRRIKRKYFDNKKKRRPLRGSVNIHHYSPPLW